jgi:YD repeat-containing protein
MSQFSYDTPVGGQTTEKNARGFDTIYKFDNFYRITQITDANGGVRSYQYDSRSNVICETDPNGGKTASTYDSRSRLTERIDAENTDQNCALESLGKKSAFTYNTLNDPITEQDPLGRETEYRYNAAGNRTRVIKRATGGAILQLTCFGQDSFGQTTSLVASTDLVLPGTDDAACTGNKTLFGYDSAGNQTCQAGARHVGAAPDCSSVVKRVTRAYDAGGRLTSITDELGHLTAVEPDPFGNPLSVTDNLGNKTVYKYDAKGNLLAIREPNREKAAGPGPESLATQCGVYETGNGVNDDTDGTVDDGCWSTAYLYDRADRLIRVAEAVIAPGVNPVTTFSYDLAGNRISQTAPTASQSGLRQRQISGAPVGPWARAMASTRTGLGATGELTLLMMAARHSGWTTTP